MTDELLDLKLPKPKTVVKAPENELTSLTHYINIRNFLLQVLNDLSVVINQDRRKNINLKIKELTELILTLSLKQNFQERLLKLKEYETQEPANK